MANRCLCCQNLLELEGRYHPRCLNLLFGRAHLPSIPFGLADMPELVIKTGGRMSISGVQMKVSVCLNKEKGELEVVVKGGTHILKPEPDRFPQIPQNENLCMNLAKELGMPVPPHGLFSMADSKLCYIIKRFDRTDKGEKLQKESMFQLLESKDKYSGSLEKVGKQICAHATNVGLEIVDFFERVLFCFLTGNGDMHLKNWAVLIQDKTISLAPCYDLVCSKLYLPKENDSALTINAKQNKLKRSDFEILANYLKIDPKAINNIFEKLQRSKEKLLEMIINSELHSNLRQKLVDIVSARYKQLYGD